MKKYLILAVLLAVSFNFSSAQIAGDVDPGGGYECTSLGYNLRLGSRDRNTGGEVTKLQEFLVVNGSLSVDPTGYFGNATFNAVKLFQSQNGILNSGYVGPVTRGKIKEISCSGDSVVKTDTSNVTCPSGSVWVDGVCRFKDPVGQQIPNAFLDLIVNDSQGPVSLAGPSNVNLRWKSAGVKDCRIQVSSGIDIAVDIYGTSKTVYVDPYVSKYIVLYCKKLSDGNEISDYVYIKTATVSTTQSVNATYQMLGLAYDSNNNESQLTAKFSVDVTAGATRVDINKTTSSYNGTAGTFAVKILNSNSGEVGIGSSPDVYLQSSNVIDNGSYFTVPAGQKGTFNVVASFNPKRLFAGSYYTIVGLSTAGESSVITNNRTNSVTVIGEVSPYINSVSKISLGFDPLKYIISGVRFHPTSNVVNISGVTRTLPSTSNGLYIDFSPADFGLGGGTYFVQVTHPTTGASNYFPLVTAGSDASQAPTVEVVETPTLQVTYDSQQQEGKLYGLAGVKITAGAYPLSFYLTNGVPNIMSLQGSSGQSTYVKSLTTVDRIDGSSRYSGLTTIQAGQSQTYYIAVSALTKELFAGTYSLSLNNLPVTGEREVISADGYKGVRISNKVTIIGEVSPYITSTTANASVVTITGVRFHPTSNTVNIGGIIKTNVPSTNDGKSTTLNLADFGLATGTYFVQVTHPTTGASNYSNLTVSANTSVPAPEITSFYASPGYIAYGGQSAITWATANATNCKFSEGDNQFMSYENTISGTNRYTQSLYATQRYTLTCFNSSGQYATKSITISVGAAPVYTQPVYEAPPVYVAPTVTATTSTDTTPSELHAVGIYQGITSGSSNTCYSFIGTASVRVRNTGKPIVLALSSYAPTNWSVTVDSGAVLQKVIVSGYSRQTVTGVPSSVPISYYSHHTANTLPQGTVSGTISDSSSFYDATKPITKLYNYYPELANCPENTGVITSNRVYLTKSSDYFFAWQKGDSYYNNLISRLKTITGLTLIESFQGAYSAPTGGFVVPAVTTAATESSFNIANAISGINSPYVFLYDFYRGAIGGDVMALQKILSKEGLYNEEVTGNFYDKTLEAVKNFQAKHGIKTSGYVGPITRSILNRISE